MSERRLPVLDPTRDPAANLYENMPSGWFAVASGSELTPGAVLTRRLAGKDIVLFRTESGRAHAVSPYCPHMGAHLGCGGKVRGENIVCPFHAFEFNGDGRCVATPYGSPPPRARLISHPVIESCHAVFVWNGAAGEPPSFEIPVPDETGWLPRLEKVYEFRGHPQETSENSVDSGHLGIVHGYQDVKVLRELEVRGAELHVKYAMNRPAVPGYPMLGLIYAEFFIHVIGLGYSQVDVHVPKLGFHSRHTVFATPLDREKLRLSCGFALKKGTLKLPIRSEVAQWIADRLLWQAGIHVFVHDVAQDFEIWRNKRYVHPPQLVEGDGPIARYRRWARQFYPQVVGAPERESSEEMDSAAE